MAATLDTMVLSRSGVFERLGSLLSDVSSLHASESAISSVMDPATSNTVIDFHTAFAHLSYRQDLATIEHTHLRCRLASSFDPSLHSSLCEAVLGIFPDTSPSTLPQDQPVLVRGIVERHHRRIRVGDWLLAINGNRVNWSNLNEILSKYRSARKVRLTVRHAAHYQSIFSFSLLPPIVLPTLREKRLTLPDPVDSIHAVLYYAKQPDQGFRLLYQQPTQKDIFFAAGGLFPTLTQVMHDMNEHDSPVRSISIKLAEQLIDVCVSTDDLVHYLIIVYPPTPGLHVCLLEQHTQHVVRLINFLFGSIHHGLHAFGESMDYFFDVLFYRLNQLSTPTSARLKHLRLIDEFLPAQFNDFGTCPTLIFPNRQILSEIASRLTRLECQNFDQCSNEQDSIANRYRRAYLLTGSVLFHRIHSVVSHLSNELTNDIYRFLLHYGHLNIAEFHSNAWQFVLFKEIFPGGHRSKQRSFLLVCCQNEFTLASVIESEHEQNDLNVSPDHGLIQQMKLVLNDIYAICPTIVSNTSPWPIASPLAFMKKQLKRTISMPSIGGFNQSKAKDSHLDDTSSLAYSQHPDHRVTQLVSQPESQDELYKSNHQSMVSSTLSLDDLGQPNRATHPALLSYRLQPGPYSTIFYHLDFQCIRGVLIAPYFSLNKSTQTTLLERRLFETIQQTCLYIRRKHFAFHDRRRTQPSANQLFSTRSRPKYHEIGCQFSLNTDDDDDKGKKNKSKDGHGFNFWIVAKKCAQPVEHEFFVCYHDSIAQNLTELAFTIGMASV